MLSQIGFSRETLSQTRFFFIKTLSQIQYSFQNFVRNLVFYRKLGPNSVFLWKMLSQIRYSKDIFPLAQNSFFYRKRCPKSDIVFKSLSQNRVSIEKYCPNIALIANFVLNPGFYRKLFLTSVSMENLIFIKKNCVKSQSRFFIENVVTNLVS